MNTVYTLCIKIKLCNFISKSIVVPKIAKQINGVESKEEIPHQQLFDVTSYQKYRFLSEVGKRNMTGINTNENLNFFRQGGRKSVCKEEKTPSRSSKSHAIPSRLRTKSEKQPENKIKLGFSKRSNEAYIRTEEHPMIINRMQESTNFSRLSEKRTNTASFATPIHMSKDGGRGFDSAYNPSVLINSKWTCKLI